MEFVGQKATLVEYGCFEYASKLALPTRLVLIERDMNALLSKYAAALLSVETLIFNTNITTAMAVSQARGVIVLTGARQNIPIQDCTPLQVKMSVTGYGRSDKSQVKHMVKLQLGLQELKGLDDAVDAIAIAITGYHLQKGLLA